MQEELVGSQSRPLLVTPKGGATTPALPLSEAAWWRQPDFQWQQAAGRTDTPQALSAYRSWQGVSPAHHLLWQIEAVATVLPPNWRKYSNGSLTLSGGGKWQWKPSVKTDATVLPLGRRQHGGNGSLLTLLLFAAQRKATMLPPTWKQQNSLSFGSKQLPAEKQLLWYLLWVGGNVVMAREGGRSGAPVELRHGKVGLRP